MPCHVLLCIFQEAFKEAFVVAFAFYAVSCLVIFYPVSSDCPVTSTCLVMFFYASFKKHLSWPLHFMLFHALAFFLNAPRQGHVDFDVRSCLAFFLSFSSRTSYEVSRKGNESGREGEGRIGATQG
jgi:hypothetical protein